MTISNRSLDFQVLRFKKEVRVEDIELGVGGN